MKTTVETSLATTGDLSLCPLDQQGLYWWLYCVSIERQGPVPVLMLGDRMATCEKLANSGFDLIHVENDNITVTATKKIIDQQNKRREQAAKAAESRWKTKPPNVLEVHDYVDDQSLDVDPQQFCDYYERNGWKIKGISISNWRNVCRSWHNKKQKAEQGQAPSNMWGE